LLVGGDAAADAVARARRMPELGVGLHVATVRARPVLPAKEIPELADSEGRLPANLVSAGFAFFFGPSVRRQLKAEIRAQFAAFKATGLPLDHVNAHHHMQLHPTVLGLILEVGREYGMRAVRLPYEPMLASWQAARSEFLRRLLWWCFLAPWAAVLRVRLKAAGIGSNHYIFGMNDTGRMDQGRVLRILAKLPGGVSEIYFHPATSDWPGRDPAVDPRTLVEELKALTSCAVAQAIRSSRVPCGAFGDFATQNARGAKVPA